MPFKSSIAACALVFALSFAALAPAAAEMLPQACANGPTFVRNGIPYAHQCVTWVYAYGRQRCSRWMPVMCGGGGTGNRR